MVIRNSFKGALPKPLLYSGKLLNSQREIELNSATASFCLHSTRGNKVGSEGRCLGKRSSLPVGKRSGLGPGRTG